jgi:hypothetical protein
MDITQAVITIVGANLIMIVSSLGIALGITITLYLHNDKKIDAMAKEMEDFHGKLCAIEERKKLEVAK